MAILNTYFEDLITDIEPNKKIKTYAPEAHIPVRDFLQKDIEFKDFFVNSFLYGSYKRHTAVGDIDDIDIAIITNFDPNNQLHTPVEVLKKLKKALNNYYEIEDNTEFQRKSIKVKQALPDISGVDISLDLIPAIAPSGENEVLLVPDRELKKWVQSNPKGHLDYTTKLNDNGEDGEGKYVRLVKLMKWWWKYQSEARWPGKNHKPKGFWIECLTGINFNSQQENWADHFITILEGVVNAYGNTTFVPQLPDPGLPGESIKTAMTLEEFQDFMKVVKESLEIAKLAYADTSIVSSSIKWQKLFGGKFPAVEKDIYSNPTDGSGQSGFTPRTLPSTLSGSRYA